MDEDIINLKDESTEQEDKFFDEELDVISILRNIESLAEDPSPEALLKKKLEDEYYRLDSAGKKMIIDEITVSLNNSGKDIPEVVKKVYKNFLNKYGE